jgi:hypothetical protein
VRIPLAARGKDVLQANSGQYSFVPFHIRSAVKWDPGQARDRSVLAVVGKAEKAVSGDVTEVR